MKNVAAQMSLFASRRDVRILFVVFTLAMYIISGGAPDATGGVGL